MGYESEIPPIPTRNEEIAMIKRYADSFIAQPSWRFEQNHSRRITNLEIENETHKVTKHYWVNFGIGMILSSPLIYYAGGMFQRSNSGVPFYYRPKYFFTAPKYYNEGKRMKTMLMQIGLWLLIGSFYANRYTNTTFVDDEHMENYKIHKML
jgi:hypothetical protein